MVFGCFDFGNSGIRSSGLWVLELQAFVVSLGSSKVLHLEKPPLRSFGLYVYINIFTVTRSVKELRTLHAGSYLSVFEMWCWL